jgi:hypothetical protein
MGVCQSTKNNSKGNLHPTRQVESQFDFEEFMKLSLSNKKKGVLIKCKLYEIKNGSRTRIAKYLFIEYNGNISSRVLLKNDKVDIVYFGKIDSRGNINLTSELSKETTVTRRTFEATLDDNYKAVGFIKEKDHPNIDFELSLFTNKFCTVETKKSTNVMIRYNKGVVSGISKDSDGYLYLWGGVEDKGHVKIFQRQISDKEDVETHLYVGAIDKITGIIEGKLENGERFVMKSSKFKALSI